MTRVSVISPQGELGTMEDAELARFAPRGWRAATEQDYQAARAQEQFGALTPVLAAGAGAARALTWGGSSFIAPQAQAELAAAAPGATTVGEIGGIALGVLASGGANLLGVGLKEGAKLAARGGAVGLTEFAGTRAAAALASRAGLERLAARGVAGKAIAKAAELGTAGALTGAAYGAGNALSEANLQDRELTVESLLAHAGEGVLLGGGLGAAFGGATQIKPLLAQAFKALPEQLEKASERATINAFGLTGTNISAIRKARGNQKAFEPIVAEVRSYILPDGKPIFPSGFDTLKGVDADVLIGRIGQAVEIEGAKIRPIVQEIDTIASDAGRSIDLKSLTQQLDDEVIAPLATSDVTSRKRAAKAVRAELEALYNAAETGESFGFERLWTLRRHLDDEIWGRRRAGYGVQIASENADDLMKARNLIEQHLTAEIDRLASPELRKLYTDAKSKFSNLVALNDEALRRQSIREGNRRISLSDYISIGTGMAAGGGAGGIIGYAANKWAREYSLPFIADMALRGSKFIRGTARSVVEQGTKKPGLRSYVIPAAIQLDSKRDREKLKDTAIRVSQFAADPEAAIRRAEQMTAALDMGGNGDMVAHVAAKLQNAAGFLASKAPKQRLSTAALNPLQRKWEPSETELQSFARYLTAVERPYTVLEDLAKGVVTKEGAEALRVVWPKMHNQLTEEIRELAGARETELDYETRMLLSTLFGTPLDEAQRPEIGRAIQESLDANQQEQEQREAQAQRYAANNMGVAQGSMTKFQRVLEG